MLKILKTDPSEKAIIVSKRAYSTPRFIGYGSIKKITLNGPWLGSDGNNTNCTGNAGGQEECGLPPS